MLLSDLSHTSACVAQERSRLKKSAFIAACLRRLEDREIEVGVAYLSGGLRQGRIGLGYSAVRSAWPASAAEQSTLSLTEVDLVFTRISAMRGAGSARAKVQTFSELLARATVDEQSFLARLVFGELRQGALEGVLIEAIAKAAEVAVSSVRRASMLAGDLVEVAAAALRGGAPALSEFRLRPLTPIKPMLAQSAEDLDEVFKRHPEVALEHKLDGARIQVHRDGHEVRVFTRQLNDVSAAVPEVVEAVHALPVDRLILDGETIVIGRDHRPAPFQTTMRRFGRRLNVERMRAELPLASYYFDCLHLDGDDLIDRSGAARRAILRDLLPESAVVPGIVSSSVREARAFIDEALAAGHEGVMAKDLASAYEAGRRGGGWLKLKPSHTLDLVVLAVEWGSGRRRGWLSNLHLGARGASGEFVMLGKTFKGMTDALLAWQTKKLLELEIMREGHTVHVRPELVVEVAFDGVQRSAQYPGGITLRFARVKGYRPDKTANEADTLEAVRAILGSRG